MIFDCDLQATWRRLGGDLGRSWGRPGPSLGSSWRLLGPLGALLEPHGAVLGPLGRLLGPSWSHLGLLKTRIAEMLKNATPPTRNAHFGRQDEAKMGPRWGQDGAKMGPSWAKLGPRGSKMGPSWAKLGSSCHLGGNSEASGAILEATWRRSSS